MAPTAAATLAELMAFGFAEGGIAPKTGMTMVYGGERVLTGSQNAKLESGLSGGKGDTHYHQNYIAARGESPDSVTRNAEAFKRAMRDGRLRAA